jgi:signal transduction histidine kinase
VNPRALLEEVAASRGEARPLPALALADVDCAVEADRERLATVFSHLVQNAQEATPDDGEVRLALACDGGWVTVTVSDTGRGMDAVFLRERLFRPFDSTKGLTGMGIGVFESREYIRQLGGDIEVESSPGEGTTFRVRIPACAPGDRGAQSQDEAAA